MKILIVQNRMGIGDMVIFLPFIEAISKKFNTKVVCLVKKSSKAKEIFADNGHIKEFIILERDKGSGEHDGISGTFNLIKVLKKYKFDKIFIFNSSLRFYIISKLSGIKEVYQYPLFKKRKQHIINAAKEFLKKSINLEIDSNPNIFLDESLIKTTKDKYNINKNENNILLGIGGSGPTKRVPSHIIIKTMKLINENYNCRFFLATGKNLEEQKILSDILYSSLGHKCKALDNLKIKDILPIIKICNISICNDSSFSHLSAALEIPTIVLMTDTPIIYGNYSPYMHPIIPDGEKIVKHDTLGKEKINPDKIFYKLKEILS